MRETFGRDTPPDVHDRSWSRPLGSASTPQQRFAQIPTWLIATVTLIALVGMGFGAWTIHPKPLPKAAAATVQRPVLPSTVAGPSIPATPSTTPTPTPTKKPTPTPTPTPTESGGLRQAPQQFGHFRLISRQSPVGGELWRGIYQDPYGGQVWVSAMTGSNIRFESSDMDEIDRYQGGFICGKQVSRVCMVNLTNGVLKVGSYDTTNDTLAIVMATLIDSLV